MPLGITLPASDRGFGRVGGGQFPQRESAPQCACRIRLSRSGRASCRVPETGAHRSDGRSTTPTGDRHGEISGVKFGECYDRRVAATLDGMPVNIIGLSGLKANKRAASRHKDLDDLENLP